MHVEMNALGAQILRETSEAPLSWGAVFAGAVAAAALSLILLALGFGLGLSSVSPWSYQGASGSTLAVGAIIWLLVTSLCASGLGGYIAGRMRAKWELATESEAHFRDTTHGFLAWAIATLIGAAVLSSAASSMVGTAAAGGAAIAGASPMVSTVAGATEAQPSPDYFVDMMLRSGKAPDPSANISGTQREVRSILAASTTGDMSQGDKAYLTQLVANRTGLSPTEAEQRVTQTTTAAKLAGEATVAKAKETAEIARKAAAHTALWVFISLLVGAFYASLAATWGGKQRDPQSYLRRTA
jgi:hypothetical protein